MANYDKEINGEDLDSFLNDLVSNNVHEVHRGLMGVRKVTQ